MSRVNGQDSYILSSDLGFIRVDLKSVQGFDIEDVVHGKAISLARKIQFQNIAPTVDRSRPTSERTLKSAFLSQVEEG